MHASPTIDATMKPRRWDSPLRGCVPPYAVAGAHPPHDSASERRAGLEGAAGEGLPAFFAIERCGGAEAAFAQHHRAIGVAQREAARARAVLVAADEHRREAAFEVEADAGIGQFLVARRG